MHYHKKRKRYY